MKIDQRVVLIISVIGIVICLASFVLKLTDSDFLSAVVFLLMALYCTMNALNNIKKK